MADPTLAVHTALLARLKALVECDVWDAVPQGTDYPYVCMDSSQTVDDPYIGIRVVNQFFYLSVWSRAYGQAEVLKILGQIDAINETPLATSTGHVASVRVERAYTVREPDNLTFKGHVTLRIITQHGE